MGHCAKGGAGMQGASHMLWIMWTRHTRYTQLPLFFNSEISADTVSKSLVFIFINVILAPRTTKIFKFLRAIPMKRLFMFHCAESKLFYRWNTISGPRYHAIRCIISLQQKKQKHHLRLPALFNVNEGCLGSGFLPWLTNRFL